MEERIKKFMEYMGISALECHTRFKSQKQTQLSIHRKDATDLS